MKKPVVDTGNRVATVYFGKHDCTHIVGNIDFCMSPKRRDPRQMTLMPEAPILWAEAKNHPTDIYRMLAPKAYEYGFLKS